MLPFKVHDIVRISKYPKNHINGYGRINAIDPHKKKVCISNLNMPFSGTLCNAKFSFNEIEKE